MKRIKLTEGMLRKISRESLMGGDILSQIANGILEEYGDLSIEYGEDGDIDVPFGEYTAKVRYELVGSPSLEDWGEEGQGINGEDVEFNVYPIEIYDENSEKVDVIEDDGTVAAALKDKVSIEYTNYDFDDNGYNDSKDLYEGMKKRIKLNESTLRAIIMESLKGYLNEAENGGWVVEDEEAMEAYALAEKKMGKEVIDTAIIRAMSTHQLADILAYIFRVYDFREWDEYKEGKMHQDEGGAEMV
jgi:hypothetical protein